MDFYEKLLSYKALNKISWPKIGKIIDMEQATIRMAVDRKSLSNLQKKALEEHFNLTKKMGFSKNDNEVIRVLSDKFEGISVDEVARYVAAIQDDLSDNDFFKMFIQNKAKDIAIEILAKKIGNI